MSIAAMAASMARSDGTLLGIERIREPGACGPGPPQGPEQKQTAKEAAPGRAVREERRHLGDGEHDDQVEQEFQGRDPLSALGLLIALCVTLSSAPQRMSS
jgi:hypothetical protein